MAGEQRHGPPETPFCFQRSCDLARAIISSPQRQIRNCIPASPLAHKAKAASFTSQYLTWSQELGADARDCLPCKKDGGRRGRGKEGCLFWPLLQRWGFSKVVLFSCEVFCWNFLLYLYEWKKKKFFFFFFYLKLYFFFREHKYWILREGSSESLTMV